MNMKERIEVLINNTTIGNDLFESINTSIGRSYIISYPFFLKHFKNFEDKPEKKKKELLYQGAYMVYGWMPTILDTQKDILNDSDVLKSISSLGSKINPDDLYLVSTFMNKSIVGASKLLHFIYPKQYPIWDSKICSKILKGKNVSYQVNKIENYIEYYDAMNKIEDPPIIESLLQTNSQLSSIRIKELIIFLSD